jgi:hypothetical protein
VPRVRLEPRSEEPWLLASPVHGSWCLVALQAADWSRDPWFRGAKHGLSHLWERMLLYVGGLLARILMTKRKKRIRKLPVSDFPAYVNEMYKAHLNAAQIKPGEFPTDRFVAFVDIIAFRDIIERMFTSEPELFRTMLGALQIAMPDRPYVWGGEDSATVQAVSSCDGGDHASSSANARCDPRHKSRDSRTDGLRRCRSDSNFPIPAGSD